MFSSTLSKHTSNQTVQGIPTDKNSDVPAKR
jgi:hypothetical protein